MPRVVLWPADRFSPYLFNIDLICDMLPGNFQFKWRNLFTEMKVYYFCIVVLQIFIQYDDVIAVYLYVLMYWLDSEFCLQRDFSLSLI